MGLGPELLRDLADLKHAGYIERGARVMEIGEQQLTDAFLMADALLDEVYVLFGADRCDLGKPVGASNFTEQAPYSRQFWQSLNFNYAAIDISGNNIIRLDLNTDHIPSQLRSSQDLVINGGTTEHVANQDNAFRCIHDLTRQHGIMMHAVPCQGFITHGLVNYTLKFFWHLCRENDYEEVALALDIGPEMPVEPNVVQFGKRFGKPQPLASPVAFRDCLISAVLRKVHDREFVTPMM